jgi:hypothetical protein
MKTFFVKPVLLFLFSVLIIACGKDNYEAPSSMLTGVVTYNGKPVGVRGSNASVRLQLWQDGFPVKTPIDVFVSQDGSFSAQLFDGTYKLVTVPGNGPWEHTADTLQVEVRGDTHIDFSVRPFFSLSEVDYKLEGQELVATFDLERISETRTLDDVSLLVNDTYFVDLGHFTARETLTGIDEGPITIRLNVGSQLASSNSVFARVGVKINGITEAIYDSHVEKIK